MRVLDRTSETGNARWVLAAIASYAKPDGRNAWPSLESIRRRAGVRSERTVRRRIYDLVEAGELEVAYKAGPKGCNVYTVLCCADVDSHESTSDLDSQVSTSPRGANSAHGQRAVRDLDTAGSADVDSQESAEQEEQERKQDDRLAAAAKSGGSPEEFVSREQMAEDLAALSVRLGKPTANGSARHCRCERPLVDHDDELGGEQCVRCGHLLERVAA